MQVNVYLCLWRHAECFSPSNVTSTAGSCPLSFCCVSPCLQIFSLTLLCPLNLPRFSPSLGLSVTVLCAVFSQSFPWLPPHYSSPSLECLHPHTLWGSVSLPDFIFFIALITTRHTAFFNLDFPT